VNGRSSIALAIALAAHVPAAVPAVADEASPLELPIAIEKVWFKTPNRLFSKGGDLIVSEEGFEFLLGKRSLTYSMDEIYILSFGKLKGDLDTDWALLAFGDDGPAETIGVRDGRKMGYGGRTTEIYQLLRRTLEQQRAGQYDVPDGYRAYDAIPHHGAFAVPRGWHVYPHELILDDSGQSWGTLVFSEAEIKPPWSGEDRLAPLVEDPTLGRVMAGELPGFFLVMRRTDPGMSCDGIPPKLVERMLATGEYDPLERSGHPIAQPASATPARVGFCEGVRIRSQGRRPDGGLVVHEAYVVAHHETLFVLGLHAVEERHEELRVPFETALASLRFSVSR
jgi:hypothetical protein